MIKVEIHKEYPIEFIENKQIHSRRYLYDTTALIRQIIFEEMMLGTLPLKITLDTKEIYNSEDYNDNKNDTS